MAFQGKTVQFVWQDPSENERGIEGWVMSTMPHFDPVQGMGAAHDLLEHFTPRAGNAGEAEAFGAIVWMRLEGGYWSSLSSNIYDARRTVEEHIEGLAAEFADFLHYSDYAMVEPLDFERVAEPDDEDGTRTILRKLAAATAWACRKEHDLCGEHHGVFNLMYQWLCSGYVKVQEYYDTNSASMASLFWEIENAVDQNIKNVEHYSGDRIEIRVNPDYTWALNTITGTDEMGDVYQDGALVSDDEDEEDE